MDRTPVKSSNVAEMGYDPKAQTLQVLFKNGGLYDYHPVTQREYNELTAADSIGRHLHQNFVKNKAIKCNRVG